MRELTSHLDNILSQTPFKHYDYRELRPVVLSKLIIWKINDMSQCHTLTNARPHIRFRLLCMGLSSILNGL